MASSLAVAYLFGTFNPIHYGHLLMAQCALEQFALARVIFVPAGRPPHRPAASLAEAKHRLAMVQLAVAANPRFEVCSWELQQPEPSYTIETLRHLWRDLSPLQAETEPRTRIIIGSDALAGLHTWREPDVLAATVEWLQMKRPEYAWVDSFLQNGQRFPLHTQPLHAPLVGISATEIRHRLTQGQSVRYWLPDAVANYIAWNQLY
ncbi:MAG: nicotinate (nicotinamide) nucleotide adenylyltransferase [Candidatus Melainabacteria bacterium]|nr:nicotinate (nicotinamide) nucleotide adenylyltransferase [Candidatus Melainabacteria bacterium]